MRRQICLERLCQLMRDVDEIGFFGLNARCDFERLRDAQMSRLRLLPQRVDDQTFNAENLLRDLIRHRAAIAEISDEITLSARKHVTINLGLAVRNRQRRDYCFTQPKRTVNKMRLRLQITGKSVGPFKSEHKNALEIGHGFGGGINRHGATLPGKPPQIVEPHDVVSM